MSFSSYEQVLIVENQLVSGVSSVDIGYQTQTEPLYVAGMGYIDNYISGPSEGQMNVSRYMLGKDFIKQIGDEDSVSGGVILENGQSVGFTRGRLLNYTVSCNVGEIPEIRNTFKVYGNLGGGVSPVRRWSPVTLYSENEYVSMPNKNKGFSEDEIYESTQSSQGESPTDSSSTFWNQLDADPIESARILKQKLSQSSPVSQRKYTIPTQGSIKIKFTGSQNRGTDNQFINTLSEHDGYNPILGFNYSRGLDLDSLYALREESDRGTPLTDYEALDIQIRYPIQSTFDFTVALDHYTLSDMRAFLDYANWEQGRIEQDVEISIHDPDDLGGEPVMIYKVFRAKLLSENITSQTAEETVLNISFEGYERDASVAEPYFSGHAYDAVGVASVQTGNLYEIKKAITTDFTALGAVDSSVGTRFTASRNGTVNDGDGVVLQLIDYSSNFQKTGDGNEAAINKLQSASLYDEE